LKYCQLQIYKFPRVGFITRRSRVQLSITLHSIKRHCA